MPGTKEFNSNISVSGSILATTVPNATGTLVTWNSSSKTLSTRTNSEILSDLGLTTALNSKANANGDNLTNIQTWRDTLGIGTLTSLTTTNKSNLVNAINEVKGSVPNVTGFVPYNGANQAVNLNTQRLLTNGVISTIHGNNVINLVSKVVSHNQSTNSIVLGIKSSGGSRLMGTYSFELFRYIGRSYKFNITSYIYQNNWHSPSVTWVSGNSSNISSINLLKKSNSEFYIEIVFTYTSDFMTAKVDWLGNITAFDSEFNLYRGSEVDLTTSTISSSIIPSQFVRDSYLWNKGNFTQTDINNWNTAFDWGNFRDYGLGIKADHNSDANAERLRDNGFYTLGLGSVNRPSYISSNFSSGILTISETTGRRVQIATGGDAYHRLSFRMLTDTTQTNWLEFYHTGNFNPSQYVLQTSLNTQLANYVPINGVTTINNTKTFTSSPVVPNATLESHAVNLGQLNTLLGDYATEDWVNSQNYLTSLELAGYATETWVNQQINNIPIPTVNDGQLTLTTGTGLIGSATFTANQSGNSSFSVSVASTHKLPTVAEWNALPTTNTITRLRGTASGTFTSGDLTLLAGAGIGVTQSGSNITITNSSPNIVQTLSQTGQVVTLSNGGGSFTLPTIGVTGLRAGAGNSYIAGDLTILGGTNITISTNSLTKTFTVDGPSTGTLSQLNSTSTTIYNWNPSILNQWLAGKGYTNTTIGVNNSNYTSGTINFIASGGVTINKSGNNVTISGAFDGSSYVNKSTSNIVSTNNFSLDGIGGALRMSSRGLTLIGSGSNNPDSENWDSNFEASLEENCIKMWSTSYGYGYNLYKNDKGITNIKIPDSKAPNNMTVLPLKFEMNGATYEANGEGLVTLPNSVSNTTFTNNSNNSSNTTQNVTLANTSVPRVERVYYGSINNGTINITKADPVNGDEIIVQGRQCTIVLKKSSTVSHPIYTADQFNPVYTFKLSEAMLVNPSNVRQFVRFRYMANLQAWVVLSASLR